MTGRWSHKPIGDAFHVVNGGTPKTGVPEYWGGQHQWITPAEMGGLSSPYVSESRRTLTDEGLRVGAELVPPKSIILSTRAPIGHLVINEVPMAFNQGCKGLIPSKDIEVKFAYYFLLANISLLQNLGTGATFKELSSGKLKEVSFGFPDKPEQRRIIAILDEAFDAITTAKANTEKSLMNAKDVFESYLAHVFTEKISGAQFRSLEDLCADGRIITYGVIKLGDHIDGGIPCLRTSNVRWLRIDTSGMKRIARTLSHEYGRTILRGGEVLVNVRGTLGGVAPVPSDMAGWNVSREVAVVPIDASLLDSNFAAYWIGTPESQRWLTNVKKGAAYTGINIEDLRNLPAPVLPIVEQTALVEAVQAFQDRANHLERLYERKIIALDELKKALLQQAFTGKLTTKTTDKQLEAVA